MDRTLMAADSADVVFPADGSPGSADIIRNPRTLYGRRRVRPGALVALLIGAGLAAWAVADGRDTGSTTTPPPVASAKPAATARPVGPIGLSANGLRTLTQSVGQPIYWAGARPGYLYELTRTATGKIFIRYLPPGAKVGSKQQTYLVVATYPVAHAFRSIKNLTAEHPFPIPGGGIAIVDQKHPESVHLAYPGVDYQLEVYDPSPARSLQVATSGEVRTVPPRPPSAAPAARSTRARGGHATR
jgi:hypothetical protein